ncbi:Putative AAA+ ATPase domain, ATPase, AAA-type, core [Septoria linicola]|uniref:AAA+ ATPase domain, ATPase, AAA-type, core n=1 Tax=Septoria linicola TaxID=215465 RepID=A0A9Q9ALC1_9PEZI|nr:Putative AAA+ ATPase domain, ATPase, AAA-type, core [Septoria linicola]
MDLRRLSSLMPSHGPISNTTDPLSITELPPNILEALIPGYGLISRYVYATFGFDPSIFVSIGLVALAVMKGGQYLSALFEKWFRKLFMSSVYIDEHDDLFGMVMGWLAENQRFGSKRSLRAKTQTGSKVDDGADDTAGDALDERGIFDYTKWSARLPPRFEPYYGQNYIFHKGTVYLFKRSQKQNTSRIQVTFSGGAEDDLLQLDCIGRSTQPIKDLLRTIKIWSLNRQRNTTTIRHPTPKDRARFGGSWTKTTSRPSRPMDTVILDAEQKSMIVRDMNEYLHPASPRWYATRGIPYRRGYLFHGPPGTGKTSLSFALAGIFGLEIYAISLQEPTLTEGDLLQLFNGLPRRCIVLLEDVDAAGLLRDNQSDDKDKSKAKKDEKKDGKGATDATKEKAKKEEDYTLKDLARELKAISAPAQRGGRQGAAQQNNGAGPNRAPGTGISLSGLLNAIDGVASAEGRVLIMTTNHPEKLDAALVRPGRVDRKVAFQLAMKDQISELFVRMYAASDQVPDIELKLDNRLGNGHAKAISNGKPTVNGHSNGHAVARPDNQLSAISEFELEELAIEFAEHVPDNTFTPAEIQNHLMKYKKEPRTAVELATQWTEDLLAEKDKEASARETAGDEEDDGL